MSRFTTAMVVPSRDTFCSNKKLLGYNAGKTYYLNNIQSLITLVTDKTLLP